MTLNNAVKRVQEIREDIYDEQQLTFWISELDGHVAAETLKKPFTPYSYPDDGEKSLLMPPPYDSAYMHYIEAMSDYSNGEYGKYNNSFQMFNDALTGFKTHYIRNNMPERADIFNVMG